MSEYILIITLIHPSISAVDTQRITGFASYQDCATHAVAWADSQRDLYLDTELTWSCQKERD